jgi:hypothetical protein
MKRKQQSLTSLMACTNLNNPNSSEGPPGPRRSTNEYRRNSKKKIPFFSEGGRATEVKSVIRLAIWAVVLRRIVSNGPSELHYAVSSALQIHSITVPLTFPRHSQHHQQKVTKISCSVSGSPDL